MFQLTFRAFTKPRSRAKHGAGVSTPTEICYFHGLRGKRAKRALREMSLLDVAGAAGCPTRPASIDLPMCRADQPGASSCNRLPVPAPLPGADDPKNGETLNVKLVA